MLIKLRYLLVVYMDLDGRLRRDDVVQIQNTQIQLNDFKFSRHSCTRAVIIGLQA